MTDNQRTIRHKVSIHGKGLHTNQTGTLTFHPAEVNHGIKFRRVDLKDQPVIDAVVDNVIDTSRGTCIGRDGIRIFTIEHVMASLCGLRIDNILIDIDVEEMPIIDGSAKYFVQALEKAGIEEQNAPREYIVIKEPIHLKNEERGFEMFIEPCDTFKVDVKIDYGTKVLNEQEASLYNIEDFKKEIAPCRTFVFLHELEFLLQNNLIKGGDMNNAIIFVNRKVSQEELDRLAELFEKPKVKVQDSGILNNLELYFENEPARHKLLDVIGDLNLLGKPIKGHVKAIKPGHFANTQFAKLIKESIKHKIMKATPPFDLNKEPVYNTIQIQKIIPHRPPMLLVDKIIDVDDKHIIGVKNVTMNEPFFVGHFPQEPVMPGVLIVEAMSQTGGIYVLHEKPDAEKYSTYFLKIEEAKFRNKVVPGDTLVFVLELISPVRRGICHMKAIAYVGNKIVAEANLLAQVIKTES